MQFHLNGFRPGDPRVSHRDEGINVEPEKTELPEHVDVLIVGCGPAGLTLAAQLAAFPDVTTCIVDQKPGPLELGQADGVACRTMEMFEAFEFSEKMLSEAYWVNETTFWKPDSGDRSKIVRSDRIQDTEDGLSEFPHVILNQARVHDFLLEVMRNSPAQLEPAYSRRLVDLKAAVTKRGATAGAKDEYPVTSRFEHVAAENQKVIDTIRSRFVVGCDGARSTVRNFMGHEMQGDFANQAWGVMDVLAVTDFPDIRFKSIIQSADEGNILIIPREGGYLVRLYIELDKLSEEERVSGRNITIDQLISAAQRILNPYTLDVKEVAWWSVYEIGQRLCDRFDESCAEADEIPRLFIAGDACHTHSPKAGQGMNVSMQDSFNLGWKLAAAIRGYATPELLRTYSDERQPVAQELIDFDREFARMFSAPPSDSSNNSASSVDPATLQSYFVRHGRFTAGTATRYGPSLVCGDGNFQTLAEGFAIGKRFHSARVVRASDAKPVELGHCVKADGRWRLFVFSAVDDPGRTQTGVLELCRFLETSASSPIRRYTRADDDIDSVIDVRAIFQQSHRELQLDPPPALLRPAKGRYKIYDYEKIFCSNKMNGCDIYELRKIDRSKGCVVIVRPDQFVAAILPIDAHDLICAFFDTFMVIQK